MCQLPIGPDQPSCTARDSDEPCGCEACVNNAAADIPNDAIYVGHFAEFQQLVSFIEKVAVAKVDDQAPLLPTGESADIWCEQLVVTWLANSTLVTDGYGDYFWLSAPHAAFWGVHSPAADLGT